MKHKLITFVSLITASTATIHFINKSTEKKWQKDLLKTETDKYYENRFGKVRYQKKGSGKPVLLIHGLETGSSSYEFEELAEKLSSDYLVYSIDLLGYGLSDKPEITYTNYFYVQLLIDFIKNVIGEKTYVVTSGDTSSIILMSDHTDSSVIEKMCLINPQYLFDMNKIPSDQNKFLQTVYELPIIGTFVYHFLKKRRFIKKKFISDYFYDTAKIKEKDIDAYMESAHAGNAGGKYSFASVENYYTNINFLQALKSIQKDILLLGGTDVKEIKTNLENYKYYNDNITIHYVPNTKQLPHMENPDKVEELISTFLR